LTSFLFLAIYDQNALPYVQLKKNAEGLVGNDRFEGFCVDLIEGIAQILGFNYTFKPVRDGKYGNPVGDTGLWNGMIGELQDHVSPTSQKLKQIRIIIIIIIK
jgi:hypothetical protein